MAHKNRVMYQYTSDNSYMSLPDEFEGDLPKAEYEDDIADDLAKRRKAMNKYKGDVDRDSISDSAEIQVGLHSNSNQPLHEVKRYGPQTPGNARAVIGRGVMWDWDNSIIDLRVKPTNRTGRPYKMPEPKPFKLSVDFGSNHSHVVGKRGYEMNDINVHPDKYRMKVEGVHALGLKKVIGKKGSGIKAETKRDKDELDDLGKRLSKFTGGQKTIKKKESTGINLNIGANLDFSHVGITTGISGKKKRGYIV